LCVILEVKLDMGSGDSNFQGATYYGIFWQAREKYPFLQATCCPALLLEVVGPHLRVSALYWLQSVVVRPLTPFINLLWFSDDDDQMITIARILAVITTAQQELNKVYSQPPPPVSTWRLPGSSRSAVLSLAMPYPMADYVQAGVVPTGKLVYVATVPGSGQQVLVRFVRRYGREAHATWAAAGLAPELNHFKRLPGGWLLVEMEWLDAKDGWVELASWRDSDVAAAASAAQAALQRAHSLYGATPQQVFAHGDMRVQNIMVRNIGLSYEVRFVDFELSGEAGKALYPAYLSPHIKWPAGVEFGKPLLQEHDTALFAANCQELLEAVSSVLPPPTP
jgi:hypothetical protein